MADWYVSSAAYAAIAAFVPSVAYTVGQIVKPTAPTANNRHAFRCTTAGTASTEPAWSGAYSNNATVTTGGATFTNVTGQSTYFWAAAAGDLGTPTGDGSGPARVAIGDRVFLSSDHSESYTSKNYFQNLSTAWTAVTTLFISVNRAGSTPPVAADITSGATFIATSTTITLDGFVPLYLEGWNIQVANSLYFGSSGYMPLCLKNCAIWLNNAVSGGRIQAGNAAKVTLDNTTAQFGAVGQGITSSTALDLTWINTPSAIPGATIPTILFPGAANPFLLTCRGVDLSAATGTLATYGSLGTKALFDSCKIASGVTRFSGTPAAPNDIVELVNCFDGTKIVNERYVAAGSVVTERTITLSGGAADDVGAFSHKMVSGSAHIDKWVLPLEGFWFDVENQSVGVSHTATVEIISSASLNNDDISLLLEYQGTSGSPVASFGWSLPATPLTANAAVATSTATWNSSPATPVKQHLQVTFTPQVAGRVRGQVRLGKASTTVYVNPQITIT